tara:strand:+ start:13080 stop:14369 length:1290 start_codon:yes stop_codon:yes gene_type:complete
MKKPMPEFTSSDHQHNLKYNLAHEFFWGFGLAFHTIYAIVPLFLRELGAPESLIVSTPGIFSLLIAIPMLFIAAIGRNIINIKKAVILAHGFILIVTFAMGYTFCFSVLDTATIAWKIYFFYFLIYAFSIGIVVPIWADFLNQSTLKSERGKFFGLGFAFHSIGSFIGGFALRYLLNSNIHFPQNFGIGFMTLFISLTIGTILFIPFRVKSKKINKSYKTVRNFIQETFIIILKHQNFQNYILSRIFYTACLPGMGLYAVYCQDRFEFDISEAGVFTILNVLAASLASFLAGKLGDEYGHKSAMMVAYLGHFLAVILAIFAQNMIWVYGIFIFIGIGQGAFMPSAMNLIYDFAENRDTKIYMGLVDTLLAPFVLAYIVGIGYLIQFGQYETALAILGSSLFIGIILLQFLVKDPNHDKNQLIYLDRFST